VHHRPRVFLPFAFTLLLAAAACPGSDAAPRSASSPSRGAGALAGDASPAIPASCPVPVCRYEGTSWAEDLVGDELVDRGEARVTWRFSHMAGSEAVYLPAGSATAAWRTERCAISLDPTAHRFSAAPNGQHSRLTVNFTTRPVRYSGVGTSEWPGTQTWRCRGDEPFTQADVSTTWFAAENMMSDDPGRLSGTVTSGSRRSGWTFVNAP
jgi:hypothetical protein